MPIVHDPHSGQFVGGVTNKVGKALSQTVDFRLTKLFGKSVSEHDLAASLGSLGKHATITITHKEDGVHVRAVFSSSLHKGKVDPAIHGLIERRYHRDEHGVLSVEHKTFILPKAEQGKGVAREHLRKALDSYEQLGVQRVHFEAGLSAGKYVWARLGFDAANPYIVTGQTRQLHEWLKYSKIDVEVPIFQKMYELADWKVQGRALGKEFLLSAIPNTVNGKHRSGSWPWFAEIRQGTEGWKRVRQRLENLPHG